MIEVIKNYVNGELTGPSSKKYIDVFEPATGKIYSHVPNSDDNDTDLAVSAAREAFPIWSKHSLKTRSNYLLKLASEIKKDSEDLAFYESRDTGKPISLARRLDIPRAIENFTFFIDYTQNFTDHFTFESEDSKNYIQKSPLGVVACITPWNLPLYLLTWKIVPALIMGNTVVAKPSEITPYTAFKLAEICKRINLPPGVLNIINGSGDRVGKRITNHPDIKAISFTGGTETGEKIFNKASRTFKKLALEMGGKNPAIIFEDCNYDQMLETVVKSSFTNQGQICLCSSRLLIAESIYEKFKIDFCKRVSEINIGDPNNTETQFGAITSKPHFDKINHYINLIDKENGSILVGGNIKKLDNRCEKGWFIEPTVVEGLGIDSQLNKDEIFGPIVTLQTFSAEAEAIKLANKTKYGLSATIWSEDISKANRVAEKIDSGVIWINCWMVRDLRTPFGGLKQSGYGKEGGEDALRFFTEQKNICIQS